MISALRVSVSIGLLAGVFACENGTGLPVATDAELELAGSGFSAPVFVTAPPGDTLRLFVVEQSGLIRIVRADTTLTAPFLDLVDSITTVGGEQGLLGLAFHPQYATNGYLFVHYSNQAGDTRIVRYQVSAAPDVADPASASPVLSVAQPFPNHNGGMIAFGPDGYLYIALGDGGSGGDPQGHGQNSGSLLGKILRIDVDGAAPYAVPPTNPFVGVAGSRGEIWSLGLRNPWRFSFDRADGTMYIGDVGQNQIEEIDVEPSGAGGRNYGWNITEGDGCYSAAVCSVAGLTAPVHQYTHADGCSVTGGYVYRGTRMPALQGTYFYADYCGGWVRSFRWQGAQAVEHRDWAALAGGNISSFGQDGRGELYVVRHGGTIHRVVEATP